MSHCDPEMLALRSLGEVVGTPEQDAHLASCEQCRGEVSSLRAVVTVARAGEPIELVQPSPQVWQRVRAELGLSAAELDLSAAEQTLPHVSGHSSPSSVADALLTHPDSGESADEDETAVVSLAERRARRTRPATWLLAAAGVGGLLVGGGATAMVLSNDADDPATTVAASVGLDPLPDWQDAAGSAELTVTEDGQQVLVVSLSGAATGQAEGFQEVWLIDENVEGMLSLGILEGSSGEFVVPSGVDVSSFPIVDVSLEPFDGDPTHSGDSIVRGQIEA